MVEAAVEVTGNLNTGMDHIYACGDGVGGALAVE